MGILILKTFLMMTRRMNFLAAVTNALFGPQVLNCGKSKVLYADALVCIIPTSFFINFEGDFRYATVKYSLVH